MRHFVLERHREEKTSFEFRYFKTGQMCVKDTILNSSRGIVYFFPVEKKCFLVIAMVVFISFCCFFLISQSVLFTKHP